MLSLQEFTDEVFEFLEELQYPELVRDFKVNDVANSLGPSIAGFWAFDISPRMAALVIYGMTWEQQIVPRYAGWIKH